jgi:uracil-DNA glycosylase
MKFPINDWKDLVSIEREKEYFKQLMTYLDVEYDNKTIYPSKNNIFNALTLTPLKDIKVVIIGQDPYHQPNQANGLAFSVNEDEKIPPSLRNIVKEVVADTGQTKLLNGDLTIWAHQGVLLLNTVLTVEEGKPESHKNKGWELFTDRIISEINSQNKPIVFMLWGKHAQSKEKLITNNIHLILKTTHPSPLSASRGFLGSKHFSKSNLFLEQNESSKICW